MVCSNKLLRDVNFILLLNKSDILEAKLGSEISFAHYVTSYKDKPNSPESVIACACFYLLSGPSREGVWGCND